MAIIEKAFFGRTLNGEEVYAYTLKTDSASATVVTYGGTLISFKTKDKNGNTADVVLGYDTVGEYEKNGGCLGALIGRFGNRIDKGQLTIDGKTYSLYLNDRGNHLHGGKIGFNRRVWNAEEKDGTLVLTLTAEDGEENYPGKLEVKVVYSLTGSALKIDYTAVSDKKTAINLTNHAYFNIDGESDNCSILENEAFIDAPMMTPTDATLIPHGEFRGVKGTPFDFTTEKPFGKDMFANDEDIKKGGGFDHCFVFAKDRDKTKPFARVYGKKSGLELVCYTDQPAVQLYTANGLNNTGKQGHKYGQFGGFCLETQAIPNNVNVPAYAEYGSSIYDAGKVYRHTTVYELTLRK